MGDLEGKLGLNIYRKCGTHMSLCRNLHISMLLLLMSESKSFFVVVVSLNSCAMPQPFFVSVLVSYSLDAAHMPLSSENYDSTVFRFLSNMMARNDSRDTFIVLRSDHGLQGEVSHLISSYLMLLSILAHNRLSSLSLQAGHIQSIMPPKLSICIRSLRS